MVVTEGRGSGKGQNGVVFKFIVPLLARTMIHMRGRGDDARLRMARRSASIDRMARQKSGKRGGGGGGGKAAHCPVSLPASHYMSLMVGHWCKVASEAVARTLGLFSFVDTPACLAQDD